LLIDTVVCLTLAKWETVSGRFGGYLTLPFMYRVRPCAIDYAYAKCELVHTLPLRIAST